MRAVTRPTYKNPLPEFPRENDTITLKRVNEIKEFLDKEVSNSKEKLILYRFYELIIREMNVSNQY